MTALKKTDSEAGLLTIEILCHKDIAGQLREHLEAATFRVKQFNVFSSEEISSLVSSSDILVSWLASEKVIESGPKLKLIQCWGVGVDKIDLVLAEKHRVKVCTVGDAGSNAVAEYILSAMLLLGRKLSFYDKYVKGGSKSGLGFDSFRGHQESFNPYDAAAFPAELTGKTLLIIGYGRIGTRLACKAKSLGMRVFAIRREPSSDKDENADLIGNLSIIQKVLPETDFLSINLPLTQSTKNVVGEKELKMMKPSAYVINTSRSEVLDNEALVRALEKNWIAGAALDVFEERFKNSFVKMQNVILTPHIAGNTVESRKGYLRVTIENIMRYSNGEHFLNVIQPTRAY